METLELILNSGDSFRYQLLDRLKCDCEYYLGYGNRCSSYLWAKDEKEQIKIMKYIWNSFSKEKKPEWLTSEQIMEYEGKMVKAELPDPIKETDNGLKSAIRKLCKNLLSSNWKILELINRTLKLFDLEICIICYKIEKSGLENHICSECWEKYDKNLATQILKEEKKMFKTPCGCEFFDCSECANMSICCNNEDD